MRKHVLILHSFFMKGTEKKKKNRETETGTERKGKNILFTSRREAPRDLRDAATTVPSM